MPGPAREILSVDPSGEFVTLRNSDGLNEIAMVASLPRHELMVAAKVRFPSSGIKWIEYGAEEIRTSLATGVLPTQTGRTSVQVETIPAPTTTATTTTNGHADPAAAIDALRRALGTPTVDESQVRAIVAESLNGHLSDIASLIESEITTLSEKVSRPIVHSITLPTRTDPIILEGRQHPIFEEVLSEASIGHHCFIYGPPGTGKSTLAKNIALALDLPFYLINCEPGMMKHDLLGYKDAVGAYHRTEFRDWYEYGGILCIDEQDNGNSGILAVMNGGIENGQMAFPDGKVKRCTDKLTVCIGTANTNGTGPTRGFMGRNAIDAATLDRFESFFMGIDEDLERDLTLARIPNDSALAEKWLSIVRTFRANVERHNLTLSIGPRASLKGAESLASGRSVESVIHRRIHRGLTKDQWAKVAAGTEWVYKL